MLRLFINFSSQSLLSFPHPLFLFLIIHESHSEITLQSIHKLNIAQTHRRTQTTIVTSALTLEGSALWKYLQFANIHVAFSSIFIPVHTLWNNGIAVRENQQGRLLCRSISTLYYRAIILCSTESQTGSLGKKKVYGFKSLAVLGQKCHRYCCKSLK